MKTQAKGLANWVSSDSFTDLFDLSFLILNDYDSIRFHFLNPSGIFPVLHVAMKAVYELEFLFFGLVF